MVERNFILFAFPVSILVSHSLGTKIHPNCKLVVSLSHENCLYSGCKEHISVAQQKRPIYSNNIHWKGKIENGTNGHNIKMLTSLWLFGNGHKSFHSCMEFLQYLTQNWLLATESIQ